MHRLYKFNEDKEGFGNNLKKLMKEKGYTVESFSKEIGYDENTIKKWRAGKRIPDLDRLKSIAKIFGITIQELYLPNSIYEGRISDDFQLVLDGKLLIKKSDDLLLEELISYSDYLFQKMLFSYLNPRDVKALRNIFMYFMVTDYAVDRLAIVDKTDFDEFRTKIKQNLIEQYGKGLPYRINDEISKQILKTFEKYIVLNMKEGM